MSEVNNGYSLRKKNIVYILLFIIIYLGVMLLKYLMDDRLTWQSTFVFMFSVTGLYILLRGKESSSNH